MNIIRKITLRGFLVVSLIAVVDMAVCQSSVERYAKLRQQLLSADTVLIVSHEDTAGFFENSDGSASPSPPLILSGKLNASVIKEKAALDKKKLLNLNKILTARVTAFSDAASCFIPHHSIVLIAKKQISSIEICFGCHQIRASQDIDFSGYDLSDEKWKKLKQFFLQNNFKYELK